MMPRVAVLTGDLIASTTVAPAAVDMAMARIDHISRRIGTGARFERQPSDSRFVQFRGDSWQVYLQDPGLALATALLILAELRAADGLDTRIAIGVGDVAPTGSDGSLPANIGAATGSAFIASGRSLDQIKAPRRLEISGEGVDRLHRRLILMIDEMTASWSKEQAEATALVLAPEAAITQKDIAERLNISRQAVASRLAAAKAAQLNAAALDFLYHFGSREDQDG